MLKLQSIEKEVNCVYPLTNGCTLLIDGVLSGFALISDKSNIFLMDFWGFEEFPESAEVVNMLHLIEEKYGFTQLKK